MLDLTTYGFTSDPFPLLPKSTVRNWAGRDELRRELVDIVESVRVNDIGISEFVILHGEYGSGKSHSLRYFTTLINEDKTGKFESQAVYISSIRTEQKLSFLALYKQIIATIGKDFLHELAEKILSCFKSEEEHLKATLKAENVLAIMESEGMEMHILHQLPKEDQPFTRMLLNLAGGDNDVLDFLDGKKGYPDGGYPSAISSDFVATKVLGSLFRSMCTPIGHQECPFTASYLFLDEVEAAMDVKVTESGPFFNAIRELVNELPYNFCLILSFSTDAALLEAIMPVALMKRLTQEYLEFPDMQVEEAKDFLEKQFSDFRPEGFTSDNKFFPFTEDAIELILENRVPLTPRDMFRDLKRVFQKAIKRHDLKEGEEITAVLADEVLLS